MSWGLREGERNGGKRGGSESEWVRGRWTNGPLEEMRATCMSMLVGTASEAV